MYTKSLHVHRRIGFGLLIGSALLFACMLAVQPVQAQSLTAEDITMAVERELLHDPGVEAHRVDVSTEEGLAILSGTVDTMEEWTVARSNAYEGGATAVANNLKVRHGPERLQP